MPPDRQRSDQGPRNSSWQRAKRRLSLTIALSTIQVLGLVNPRDVIYPKTRLSTPSTDQSSRRPPHRKKCTRTANCFIGRYPGTAALDTHLSTPPFGVVPRTRKLDYTAEWNQVIFSDESRFNLSSDDNRVRVWRPRGECLSPAFALQRHTTPTAGVMVWGAIAYNT
ncbi:transposable element Tcb2 transposase [Trichonephila clavipes]|nr:transposable element Tcb2 transposase [Trichonephila clavipes]